MHSRMCLLGSFNILVYEGDKIQNKRIPLLCPGVRLLFLPSIVLSSNQPPPNTHSSRTVHTHSSSQAAEARLCFPSEQFHQARCRYCGGIKPSTLMLWSSRAVNAAAPRRSWGATCWILHAALLTKLLIERQGSEKEEERFCSCENIALVAFLCVFCFHQRVKHASFKHFFHHLSYKTLLDASISPFFTENLHRKSQTQNISLRWMEGLLVRIQSLLHS